MPKLKTRKAEMKRKKSKAKPKPNTVPKRRAKAKRGVAATDAVDSEATGASALHRSVRIPPRAKRIYTNLR
jgi:hypothetical protein